MLLGIVLHASLSFFPSFWIVSDRSQAPALGVLFSAIHGFRMPLFFVMSGFFAAMLLKRLGRGAWLRHRFRRVLLPMLLGLVTIVPATTWISSVVTSSARDEPGGPLLDGLASGLGKAASAGDLEAIEKLLADGAPVNGRVGDLGVMPLHLAALSDRSEAVALLIERGADVNAAATDGGTPLHASAFAGCDRASRALVEAGADVNAENRQGRTPLDGASLNEESTLYYASLLKIPVDKEGLGPRKEAIAAYLREQGATLGKTTSLTDLLMQWPILQHLWFLWFLWWLSIGLAIVSAVGSRLPSVRLPDWLVVSPARYFWLVPLTMTAQWFMGEGGGPQFGPDTSAGLLPVPHVLAYYAIFFGFGALEYGCGGRVGGRWWLSIAIGLLVVLPMGLALSSGWPGAVASLLGPIESTPRRLLSVGLQSAYPWLLTFGLMGLFRRTCPAENATVRYVSDASYWLYLVHLPLIVAAQSWVRDWPLPAIGKCALIVGVVTPFLLWTYAAMVRHTWLGRLLNGPRVRPDRPRVSPVVIAPLPASGSPD